MGGGDYACGLWGFFLNLFHFRSSDEKNQIIKSTRDQKPLHYTLKIQSFSLLHDAITRTTLAQGGRYESREFDAGGYKWKLALYLNGDEKRNGSNHISLYLVTAEDDILSSTSEVYVKYTFLVFDHIKDKYLTFQDGKIRRFHSMKREWGFSQLLPFQSFKDSSKGFLVDDQCIFGVEIFVMKHEAKEEVFSLIKQPKNNEFIWKLSNFSKLEKDCYQSDLFNLQGYNWKLALYPQGNRSSLSLYMILDNCKELPPNFQVFAKYEMTLKRKDKPSYQYSTSNSWFTNDVKVWGFSNFISLKDLMEPSMGFIVNDVLTVEVNFHVISTIKKAPHMKEN